MTVGIEGTCKTCLWWEQGQCDFVNTVRAKIPETRFEVDVDVADDHGLHTRLLTGPDFGCVHHFTYKGPKDEQKRD